MKIVYFDLGITDFFEDYSIKPKVYGGGPCFARFAKEFLNNANNTFIIIGQKENFQNLTEKENKNVCFSTSKDILNAIKNGYPPALIWPELADFDIFIHHHDCLWINPQESKAKSIHWSLSGKSDGGHPNNFADLLYTHSEKPTWPNQRIEKIQIGKPVPKFQIHEKEDFVFTCTRHDTFMNSIEIAENCLKYKIKGYFAGPIHNNYPILDFINNKTTFYLGLLSEEDKLDYTRKAVLYPLLCNWDVVFNQSAIEANGEGTPILGTNRGWLGKYIVNGQNGFIYNNNFLESYHNAKYINQQICNNFAQQYNVEKMIDSFYNSFIKILK